MKWPALIGLALGLAAAILLVVANDMAAIGRTLAVAGWGVLAVAAVHLLPTLLASAGWREMIDPAGRPSILRLFKFRWIKEGVNSLLPVAQVGGEFVRARLLMRRGASLANAAAACTVDVALGTLSLFLYALMGLTFYLQAPHDMRGAGVAQQAVVAGGLVAVVVLLAPRLGLLKLIEALIARMGAGRWAALGDVGGIHEAVLKIYRDPRRLAASAFWHLTAWMAGTIETYVSLTILGLNPTLAQAFVIDSLGQGVRAAGFAIPGALGVQEGGYILVCGLFGIPAEQALAFSLVRRIRELILGAPALLAWGRIEGWTLRSLFARKPKG